MRLAIFLLFVFAGCAILTLVAVTSKQSNVETMAASASFNAMQAAEKSQELAAEVANMSAEIRELREEQLDFRERLATQELRLADVPLAAPRPQHDQEQRELEYLEKRYGRLEPEQQRLAREAAERLTQGAETRDDAIFLEQQIGSNELSDGFFEKNGEDLGAVREAIE